MSKSKDEIDKELSVICCGYYMTNEEWTKKICAEIVADRKLERSRAIRLVVGFVLGVIGIFSLLKISVGG